MTAHSFLRAAAIAAAMLLAGCAAPNASEQAQDLLHRSRADEAVVRLEQAQRAPRVAADVAQPESPPTPAAVSPKLAQTFRKPITIEFRDAPLRAAFNLISRTSGLNFVFDKDVRTDQKTSIFLKDSTVEAAVQRILLTNQLQQRVLDDNTVLVYPATAAKQKDYQPLVLRAFYLAHAEAKDVAATLKALIKSRDVVVDEKLNLLIVRDSAEAVRLAAKLVALHDIPEPEVMLEVEILEVKRARLLDLGVRWPDQLNLVPLASAAGGPLTLADLRDLNSRAIGAAVGPFAISARKTDADAKILANPRIRARNREKARILIGERVPNITATATSTGFVAESVTYVDVGLKLEVEPTVYLDGEVAIKVGLEVSNIISQLQTKSGSVAYQIGTRTAHTALRLKDGENQVLAGLINDEDRRTGNRVPGLGALPVLGRLFGNQADDHSKTEIVLSITPRVLRNVQRPAGAALEFDAGTENNVGVVWTPPVTPAPQAAAADAPDQASAAASAAASAPAQADAPVATRAAAAAFSWDGPAEAQVGDQVSLRLGLAAGPPVHGLPLTVTFDPRVLQVVSVAGGDLPRADGANPGITSRIDPGGQVLITATSREDQGMTGPGTLAVMTFRVTAAAAAQTGIELLNAAPSGPHGKPLPARLPPAHRLRVRNPAPVAR